MSESERRPERSARDPKKRLGRSELGRGSDSDTESIRSSRRSNRPAATNGSDEPRSRIDRNEQGEIVEYRHDDGQSYKVGDAAYITTQRSDVPYVISKISEIKVTKSGKPEFVCRPFHRPDDLPDQIYQKLTLDREKEFSEDSKMMEKIKENTFSKRELFICDAEDVQRDHIQRTQIRGLCTIHYHKSLDEVVDKYTVEDDSFFCILGYNPQKRVIACLDKEFERVKQMHQWTAAERGMFNAAENNMIPEAVPYVPQPGEDSEDETAFETLTWRPNVADSDLVMYLRAARSMAAFAGMCDGGASDACNTATRDATTLNAIDVLQKCNGKVDLALEKLCQNPMPSIPQRMWTDEDIRAFIKGLSTYGKDFFYISKEYLPRKDTAELIEFYYLWKKTSEGLSVRNKYRRAPKKSMYNMKSQYPRERPVANSSEFSDDDNNSIDSQIDEDSHICRNCYTVKSSDWHHGGKENYMLCNACRIHYKKYGTPKVCVDRPETPQLLRKLRQQDHTPVEQNEVDYSIAADESSQPLPEPTPQTAPKLEPQVKKEIKSEPGDDSGQKRKLSVPSEELDTKKQKQEAKPEAPTKEEPKPAVKQEVVSNIAPESKPKVTTYATNTPFLPVSKSPTVPPSSVASNTPLINLPSHPEKTLIPPQPGETITYAGSSPRQPAAPRPITSQKQETAPKPVSIPVPQNSTPIVIPSDPVTPTPAKPVLGQPRAGVEQGPRPDPDEDHPCGPFSAQEDNARTYRTIEKIQFKKAFFVRNWEYSDGNSCARTDLFYCDEPESSGTTISRRNPTAATHSPARPATGRTQVERPTERPQSNGSSHAHSLSGRGVSHRPPTSTPHRTPGTPQQPHYRPPLPRQPMSPNFGSAHERSPLTPSLLGHPAVSAANAGILSGAHHSQLAQLHQLQEMQNQQRLALSATDPRLLADAHNIYGALRLPGVPHADLLRDQQRLLSGQPFPIPGLPQHGLTPSAISLDPHLRRSVGQSMIDSRLLNDVSNNRRSVGQTMMDSRILDQTAAYQLAEAQQRLSAQGLAQARLGDPRFDPRLYQLHQPK
ncbi:Oidioi.mRNA.OKI2018_I69.XSR.g16383.t2.cds [Oikopleura dioica]|uniref:Oidioi.mRNA.OKI2018_I69.XSR.g16383.t2.cds n=1 Tax=Oikopleura dioica TaxID=34765 RepID=A0ABN7SFX2_OIKDI|nr:Oidioi.mRNA.OKI2018_I69.XSR.g16383.t2.cds [Oikopleura dioica]